MRQLLDLEQEKADIGTIVNITSVFEGLASMRLSKIKNQVQQSQQFFQALWNIYSQIRVDSAFRYGRLLNETVKNKELLIAITAEGGFSGDIDQKLITWMLQNYDPKKQDIIIIGHHGALQLIQAGIKFEKYYKLPVKDQEINVAPLVKYVHNYRTTTVYYQTYVSLMVQDVKKIELLKAVQAAGAKLKDDDNIINERTYIFEPSTHDVVAYLERSMVEIALSQTILESKLAQYASRFRSMSVAKDKAIDSQSYINLAYNRARRSVADERLKETINGLRKGALIQ